LRILTILMLCAVGACLYFAAYSPVMAGGIETSLFDIARANLDQVAALYVLAAAIVVLLLAITVFVIASENRGYRLNDKRQSDRIILLESQNDKFRLDSLSSDRRFAALQGQVEGLHKVIDLAQLRPSNSNVPALIETPQAAE